MNLELIVVAHEAPADFWANLVDRAYPLGVVPKRTLEVDRGVYELVGILLDTVAPNILPDLPDLVIGYGEEVAATLAAADALPILRVVGDRAGSTLHLLDDLVDWRKHLLLHFRAQAVLDVIVQAEFLAKCLYLNAELLPVDI